MEIKNGKMIGKRTKNLKHSVTYSIRNMKKEFAKKSFVYKKPSTKRLLVSLILPRFSAP